MTESAEQDVKRRQILLASGLAVAIVSMVGFVLWFSGSEPSESATADPQKAENVHLADASRAISPEKEWISHSEITLKQQSEQLKALTERIALLTQNQESLKAENEQLKTESARKSGEPVLGEALLEPVAAHSPASGGTYFPGVQTGATLPPAHNPWNPNPQQQPAAPTLTKTQLALTPNPNLKNAWQEKSLQNYLPTGSYVKAVILSGVTASAAVKSQADPLPILFRVTGPAVTANHQEIDLSGCTVTGEAYGDISSERAFVRLHDLTCSKNTDKVIETKVEGYAAALGTGIQGRVISREGELIQSSFWSGLFGGIGQATAQASTTVATSPLGAVETVKGEDVLKNALGKGVASSAERISKYHIERAEQYHAVIEVKAGREVELVFIKGVYLDGRPAEKAAENKVG